MARKKKMDEEDRKINKKENFQIKIWKRFHAIEKKNKQTNNQKDDTYELELGLWNRVISIECKSYGHWKFSFFVACTV